MVRQESSTEGVTHPPRIPPPCLTTAGGFCYTQDMTNTGCEFIKATADKIQTQPESIADYSPARLQNILEYAQRNGLDELATEVTRELRMQNEES